eukprot:SAG22_NODE_10501_length_530_cov_1.159722_1_plen_69_part_00
MHAAASMLLRAHAAQAAALASEIYRVARGTPGTLERAPRAVDRALPGLPNYSPRHRDQGGAALDRIYS